MSGISTEQRAVNIGLVTTAETPALNIPFSGGVAANVSLSAAPGVGSPCKLKISGNMNVTGGAASTAIQVRCRRGFSTITGAQVGNTIQVAVAAIQDGIAFEFSDPTPGLAQAYTITVQQVGATGNGTVNEIVGSTTDYN